VAAVAQTSATGQAATSANANASAGGQEASASSRQTVPAVLTKSVDAKKAKQGDKIEAKAVQDMKGEGGVAIPKGSKLIGHVSEVKAREKGNEDSTLGIAFDSAVLKNGQQVPFHAMIAGVSAPVMAAPGVDMGMDASGTAGPATGPSAAGGPLGGVGNAAGGVVNDAGQAAGRTTGIAGETVGNTAGNMGTTAASATGRNASASMPAMGIPGVTLNASASHQTNGSVFTSNSKNVKLDSGTTLWLRVAKQ
jgi:hypothetical protein